MNEATQKVALEEESQSQGNRAYVASAYAAGSPTSGLARPRSRAASRARRTCRSKFLYCGVCHSDLHQVRNEWQNVMSTVYPCVPGHEIVGRVVKVGRAVKRFKEGDIAAVGSMVDFCRTCQHCREGLEQYCESLPTFTYNFPDHHLGGVTYGGYSESIVVDEATILIRHGAAAT